MVVLPIVVVIVEPPEIMVETMAEVAIAELAPAAPPEVVVADALPPAPLPLALGVTPGPVWEMVSQFVKYRANRDCLTVYGGTPGVYSVPVAVAADAAG